MDLWERGIKFELSYHFVLLLEVSVSMCALISSQIYMNLLLNILGYGISAQRLDYNRL